MWGEILLFTLVGFFTIFLINMKLNSINLDCGYRHFSAKKANPLTIIPRGKKVLLGFTVQQRKNGIAMKSWTSNPYKFDDTNPNDNFNSVFYQPAKCGNEISIKLNVKVHLSCTGSEPILFRLILVRETCYGSEEVGEERFKVATSSTVSLSLNLIKRRVSTKNEISVFTPYLFIEDNSKAEISFSHLNLKMLIWEI